MTIKHAIMAISSIPIRLWALFISYTLFLISFQKLAISNIAISHRIKLIILQISIKT